jgi:hypothetical protein
MIKFLFPVTVVNPWSYTRLETSNRTMHCALQFWMQVA